MWGWVLGQPFPEVSNAEKQGWWGVVLGPHPTALLSRSWSLEEICCQETRSAVVVPVAPGQCLLAAALVLGETMVLHL